MFLSHLLMEILVTCGMSFIGSHLVDELSKDKSNKIIIFDNFHRGCVNNIKKWLKNNKVRLIKGDIREYWMSD